MRGDRKDQMWDALIELGISEETIQTVVNGFGYTEENLETILYVQTGNRTFEQAGFFEEEQECEWFVNNGTVPAWCCNTHMFDGTGDYPATEDHPEDCDFKEEA